MKPSLKILRFSPAQELSTPVDTIIDAKPDQSMRIGIKRSPLQTPALALGTVNMPARVDFFAVHEMKLILANLLMQFDFKMKDEDKGRIPNIDISYNVRLTLHYRTIFVLMDHRLCPMLRRRYFLKSKICSGSNAIVVFPIQDPYKKIS